MKKYFLFSLLYCIFALSCDNNDVKSEEVYSYLIDGVPLKSSYNFSRNSTDNSTVFTVVEAESEDYNYVTNRLKLLLSSFDYYDSISSIVFYSDKNDNSNNYELKSTVGVSIFYFDNGYLWHKLYTKKGNYFVENIEFYKKTKSSIELNIVQNISLLIYSNSWHLINIQKFIPKNNELKNVLGIYVEEKLISNKELARNVAPRSLTCQDPIGLCYSNNDCPCEISPDGGLDCAVFGCGCSKDIIDKQDILPKKALSSDIAYSFRDNFLKKYAKGRKYIRYYYSLSSVLKENNYFTSNNILSDFIFYKKIYSLADLLQNGNDNTVVISADDKIFLLNKIEYFKRMDSRNLEYQEILNDIENDINTYAYKTKAQIIQTLN